MVTHDTPFSKCQSSGFSNSSGEALRLLAKIVAAHHIKTKKMIYPDIGNKNNYFGKRNDDLDKYIKGKYGHMVRR